MKGTAPLLVMFLLAALVAIISGAANSSPPIVGLGLILGILGIWLAWRERQKVRR